MAWHGAAGLYGGKPLVEYGNEPLFAELLILRIFQSDGWQGAWLDTYRNRVLSGIESVVRLPLAQRTLLEAVRSPAGGRGGAFDAIAWHNGNTCFAEAKRAGRDRVRASQGRWVAGALAACVAPGSLLVVEVARGC